MGELSIPTVNKKNELISTIIQVWQSPQGEWQIKFDDYSKRSKYRKPMLAQQHEESTSSQINKASSNSHYMWWMRIVTQEG